MDPLQALFESTPQKPIDFGDNTAGKHIMNSTLAKIIRNVDTCVHDVTIVAMLITES